MNSTNDDIASACFEYTQSANIGSESELEKSGSATTLTKCSSLNRIPPPTLPKPRSHPAPSSLSRRSSTSSLSSSSSASATPTSGLNSLSPKPGVISPGNVFPTSPQAASPGRSTGGILTSVPSPLTFPATSSYKSTATLSSSGTPVTSPLSSTWTTSPGPPPLSFGLPAPPLQAPPGPPGPVFSSG